jgi:hypothetical protein
MKQCPKCKMHLTSSSFYKDSTKKDKLTSYCKDCCIDKRILAYQSNKSEEQEYMKNRYEHKKDEYKSTALKNLYGIDLDTYNDMRKTQLFSCLICTTHEQDLKRGLFVDHCHETKKVRGLLCQHCNTLLGMAKDNQLILQEAIHYLSRTL